MRRLTFVLGALAAIAAVLGLALRTFRRSPRTGSSFVNSVVNPALMKRGLVGRGRAEIATLEHFGRRSGRRYLTPVHPEPTTDGFQILVPLGEQSHWARNVLSAGHCRLQLHDLVYELDEPAMLRPTELSGGQRMVRRLEEYLGFEYLRLHGFASAPGTLDEPVETAAHEQHKARQRDLVEVI